MVVPAADVGEGDLHAEIGFDQLRELLEAVAEASAWDSRRRARACTCAGSAAFSIFTASKVSWPVPCSTESTEWSYMASKVLAMGEAFGLFPPTPKSLMLLMATAGSLPERMRGSDGSERDGAEGGLVRQLAAQIMQGAVQPAIFGGFHAGRAGFHEILRVEMRARGIGRAGGVHDGEMTLLPQRLERCQ